MFNSLYGIPIEIVGSKIQKRKHKKKRINKKWLKKYGYEYKSPLKDGEFVILNHNKILMSPRTYDVLTLNIRRDI